VQNGVTGGQHSLAVVCHIFHADVSEEILKFIKNIRRTADIFIATDTSIKADYIEKVFQEYDSGKVVVRITENRGRDIATKLVTFRDIYNTYEIVLQLHSKKDNHGGGRQDGSVWRKFLLKNLVGSPEVVSSVLDAFSQNPKLGMVVAQHWEPVQPWIRWLGNFKEAKRLLRYMDISLTRRHREDLPSGSMFWTRTAALLPLLDLNLSLHDFPEEPVPIDGTILHTIERLFLFSCEAEGMIWIKIADPDLFSCHRGIIPVHNRDILIKLVEERRSWLTAKA